MQKTYTHTNNIKKPIEVNNKVMFKVQNIKPFLFSFVYFFGEKNEPNQLSLYI